MYTALHVVHSWIIDTSGIIIGNGLHLKQFHIFLEDGPLWFYILQLLPVSSGIDHNCFVLIQGSTEDHNTVQFACTQEQLQVSLQFVLWVLYYSVYT